MAKKTAKKKAPAKKAAAKKADSTTKKAKTTKKAAKAKDAPEKKKKKAAPKKRATRAVKEIRLKAYWGVFNQLFEFNERKLADKKAADLGKNGKPPHFVQPVKEAIEG